MSKIKIVTSIAKAELLMEDGWTLFSKETKSKYWCDGEGFYEGYHDVTEYTLVDNRPPITITNDEAIRLADTAINKYVEGNEPADKDLIRYEKAKKEWEENYIKSHNEFYSWLPFFKPLDTIKLRDRAERISHRYVMHDYLWRPEKDGFLVAHKIKKLVDDSTSGTIQIAAKDLRELESY